MPYELRRWGGVHNERVDKKAIFALKICLLVAIPTVLTSTVFASMYAWIQGRQYGACVCVCVCVCASVCGLVASRVVCLSLCSYISIHIYSQPPIEKHHTHTGYTVDDWQRCLVSPNKGMYMCLYAYQNAYINNIHNPSHPHTHTYIYHIPGGFATNDQTLFTGSAATFAMKAVVFLILSFNGVNAGLLDHDMLPYGVFVSFSALLGMTVYRESSPIQPEPKVGVCVCVCVCVCYLYRKKRE